jgi:hypothetical protein
VLDPRRLALVLAGVLLLLVGAAARGASTPAPALPDAGVALSVGLDDGTLLVGTAEGFDLVVLDTDAVIVDGRGRGIALETIRPGDQVAYIVTRWAGMSLAPALRGLGQPARRQSGQS